MIGSRSRTRRSRPAAVDVEPVAARKRAAIRLVGTDSLAAERIATAPAGYVMAHTSSDVARHCELLSPAPAPGEARVVITPGRVPGEWHLDVGSHDRPGLLAAFTGVLARQGVDVHQAVLATWDDGGALQAFVIAGAPPPEPLQEAFELSLDEPLASPPIADARVSFSDAELYTSCEVRAADRPGLLHAIAVAIASAGADVHAARVTTRNGIAHDRFDISDQAGLRLDVSLEEAIRVGVTHGTLPRRGHRRDRSASQIVVRT